jgi:GT2 family glycosyltransferase
MTVAALLAVHNRKEKTLACLESIRYQNAVSDDIDVFVLDDASSDGTAEAIREYFPEVRLLAGSGSDFWSGGMRKAFDAALEKDYEYYLWLNDDTSLDKNALVKLLDTHRRLGHEGLQASIVAGSTRDPETKALTYGGVHRPHPLRRFKFELVRPGLEPRQSETMNGNIVLIPREVAQRVGNLDAAFIHSMGDFDYGLRARQRGCDVWIAPGTLGECRRNPHGSGVAGRVVRPRGEELRELFSSRELPARPWWVFARRWGGRLWFAYWLHPYIRRTARIVLRLKGVRRGDHIAH